VIHDDIDIEFGQIKLKKGGSTAGHRGLESIHTKVQTLDFDRLRFGVGRPPGRMEASDYVLRRFSKSELKEVELLVRLSVDAIKDYITDGIDFASNKYN
jgi:PTH1 family peptidyl-tRNA hydrolase